MSETSLHQIDRPVSATAPRTTYFICCMARTGSTFLCELLASSGLAGQPSEYFPGPVDRLTASEWTTESLSDYLQENFNWGTGSNGVFGTKIVGFQYLEALVERLRRLYDMPASPAPVVLEAAFPNLHFIWLTRRDKLRQAISYRRGRMRGSPDEKIFDPDEIDRWMVWMARDDGRWQQFFDVHGVQPFRVIYEELVEAPERTAIEILRFIGISSPETVTFGPSFVQKEADELTEEWIRRYGELKRQDATGWTRRLPS